MTDRPRRTPPNPPLDAERIVDAAVALADEAGIDALSMRALAGRLGVQAMSLYHHLPGKDALLNAVVDRVFAEIEIPEAGEPWRDAVWRRTVSARAALHRHPWAVGLLDSRSRPGPATLRHHDAVIGCLRRAGFSLAETAHAFAVVDAYLYGFALQEASLPFGDAEDARDAAEALAGAPAEASYPYLAELAARHVATPDYDYGASFAIGLNAILDGLERRRAQSDAASGAETGEPRWSP